MLQAPFDEKQPVKNESNTLINFFYIEIDRALNSLQNHVFESYREQFNIDLQEKFEGKLSIYEQPWFYKMAHSFDKKMCCNEIYTEKLARQ